jgi:hypothetical protein
MSKILKPTRLVRVFLFLLSVVSVSCLVSCNQGGGGREGGAPINPDTVRNHVISIGEADQLTASFRAALDTMDKKVPHFHDSMDFGHAESFPADVFRALLGQRSDSGAVAYGIRIYYGRDANGKIRQILVPYDSLGNDIVGHYVDLNNQPKQGAHVEALQVSGGGQALQNGSRCPPDCGGDSSGLN